MHEYIKYTSILSWIYVYLWDQASASNISHHTTFAVFNNHWGLLIFRKFTRTWCIFFKTRSTKIKCCRSLKSQTLDYYLFLLLKSILLRSFWTRLWTVEGIVLKKVKRKILFQFRAQYKYSSWWSIGHAL